MEGGGRGEEWRSDGKVGILLCRCIIHGTAVHISRAFWTWCIHTHKLVLFSYMCVCVSGSYTVCQLLWVAPWSKRQQERGVSQRASAGLQEGCQGMTSGDGKRKRRCVRESCGGRGGPHPAPGRTHTLTFDFRNAERGYRGFRIPTHVRFHFSITFRLSVLLLCI